MKKIIIIFFIFLLQIIDAKALFHLKKDIKYVCEDKKGIKTLYIFDIKNKKVYHDVKIKDGYDLVIGDNYYAWEMSGHELINSGIFHENGRLMIVDKVYNLLNTDTKQLTYEAEESVTTKRFNKSNVTKYNNCEKLQ